MKFLLSCFCFVFIAALITTTIADESQYQQQNQALTNQDECNQYQSQISEVVNSFSNRLLSSIGGDGDLFISPFSISVALAMTYLGARGTTAIEIEDALGFNLLPGNETSSAVHDAFERELLSLQNHSGEYDLLVANAIFKQTGYDIRQDYIRDLKKHYNANIRDADFGGNGEAAVSDINDWVSHHTQGKIDTLFSEPLDPMTRMVLLNAIYFKGFWELPFDEELTRVKPFYKVDGTVKDVSFMRVQRNVNFYEDSVTGYTYLELDYKGDHISMLIMLPNGINEFPNLQITNTLLCRIHSGLSSQKVLIFLPKFHMEYTREISDDLQSLGVKALFQKGAADLSGMRTQNDLFASLVLHKAVIDVHEQGTEAAAVSGVVLTARSGFFRALPVFKANHPFLFCIIDKRSRTILFIGRVTNP